MRSGSSVSLKKSELLSLSLGLKTLGSFNMLKRRALLLAKYSVSIGLMALILLRANLSSFVAAVKEANILWFGAGLLVVAFNMLIRSYKWQLLLKVQGANVPLIMVQNLNYMSMFFNN